MNHDHTHTMSQKIFTLGLDTETVSVYLLCCGLADAGDLLSQKNLQSVWNGAPEALGKGLDNLKARHIIDRAISDETTDPVFRLNPDNKWQDRK
jgi:hypothetical protein